jgi:hypothetical protein
MVQKKRHAPFAATEPWRASPSLVFLQGTDDLLFSEPAALQVQPCRWKQPDL